MNKVAAFVIKRRGMAHQDEVGRWIEARSKTNGEYQSAHDAVHVASFF